MSDDHCDRIISHGIDGITYKYRDTYPKIFAEKCPGLHEEMSDLVTCLLINKDKIYI